MQRAKLTQRLIESLQPKKNTYTIYDTYLRGYGITVYPSGKRTYFVRTQADGRRKWHNLGIAKQIDEATARVNAMAISRDMRQGTLNSPLPLHSALFDDVAIEFLERYQRNWKPITYKSSCRSMATYILPYFSGWQIAEITRADVENWFATFGNRPGCANRSIPILSVMMQQAELYGYRPEGTNPCKGISRYKRQKMERFLNADEMARLGVSLKSIELRYPTEIKLIRLLILTGARKSELLTLKWDDYRDGHIFLRDSKTGEKSIFLSAPSRRILAALPRISGWVFPRGLSPSQRKIHMPQFTLYTAWRLARHAAGLDDVRMHDLRHTYASIALGHGEHLLTIGRLLGHADTDTTLKYAHLADDHVAAVARAVSRSISARASA